MSVIRRNPVNRLSALLRRPGGVAIEDALQAVDANLASVRDRCLATMDAKLAQIAAAVAACPADASPQTLKPVYALSNDVLEVAGVFGLPDLGKAAFSLCELLDRFEARQHVSRPALTVHLQGLQALRSTSPDDPVAAAVLEGLAKVVDTIGRVEPSAGPPT